MTYILHIYSTIFDHDNVNNMEVVYCYTLTQLTILYTYDDTERGRAPYVHVLFHIWHHTYTIRSLALLWYLG